jgi:L-iditol 2-dehydrogenase
MKVAAIFSDGTAGLVDKPDPVPREDFVLVKVHVTPMCTEYKGFRPGRERVGFGHEAAGEVVEVAQPGCVKVGDRVVVQCGSGCGRCPMCLIGEEIHCQQSRSAHAVTGSRTFGTYAQYVLKQDWLCSPIPDDMSYEHAGMALCGLGPTFGAMQQMQVNALDTVLITGLGPVGLGGVINASYRGARVIGVDSIPYRAELARELGADVVLDPNDENVLEQIMELTDGIGVDKAVDCSGASPAHRLMVDATRRKGQATFIGEGGEFPLAASRDMIRKGLVLRGNWHYNLGDYPRLMKVIQESGEKLDKHITHTFPMSQVQRAWELQMTGNCGKVILYPWE